MTRKINNQNKTIKHIMTLAGVEIIGKVNSEQHSDLSKLEFVTNLIQNAFTPKSVKVNLENDKIFKGFN